MDLLRDELTYAKLTIGLKAPIKLIPLLGFPIGGTCKLIENGIY